MNGYLMTLQKQVEHKVIPSMNWENWQESVQGGSGDVALPSLGALAERFRAHVKGTRFGPVFIATISATAHTFSRSRQRVALDGLDVLFVQVYEHTSGCTTTSAQQSFKLKPDTLIIQDMADSFSVEHGEYRQITLALPRQLLVPYLVENRTYPFLSVDTSDPTAAAVVNMLRLFRDQAEQMSKQDGDLMINCLVGLTANVLNRFQNPAREISQKDLYTARQLKALDVIRQRFHEVDFSSSELAQQLKMSRTSLYRLLEPMGGFNDCVREQRMRHAIRLIRTSSQETLSVQELAEECGYAHATSFTRFFKEHFGTIPSEVMGGLSALKGHHLQYSESIFAQWLNASFFF